MSEPVTGPLTCRICSAPGRSVGEVEGRYAGRRFQLAQCPSCGYGWVVDPWLDYAKIYDDRYYAGEGADPLVDYHFELEHPAETVRVYEWDGIARIVADLRGADAVGAWLDFGCGNGGLVRHLRDRKRVDATGFEEGSIAAEARALGIPIIERDELAGREGSFDVITAIEVLEHTADPMAELSQIRRLLKPGGLLFLTTGNAEPYAKNLTKWKYVIPEIHISFFEPRTLETAMRAAGLRPERRELGPGFDDILKFKVLKNLKRERRSRATDLIPGRLVRPADRFTRISDHPIGFAE
jgi:SAM-dependent methyltransferase